MKIEMKREQTESCSSLPSGGDLSKEPLIQLNRIQVGYDGKQVLRDIDLTVYTHDFLGVIGPNGGGKTTLIKTILGLKKPMSGTVTFFREGRPVPSVRMGYLPQYNKIDKNFPISVYEVVLSGLRKSFWKRYSKAQHQATRNMLCRMGLDTLADRPIGSLSGGQLQRALLGRAIISQPDVVILDEPNTYIDKRFETQLYQQLEEITAKVPSSWSATTWVRYSRMYVPSPVSTRPSTTIRTRNCRKAGSKTSSTAPSIW